MTVSSWWQRRLWVTVTVGLVIWLHSLGMPTLGAETDNKTDNIEQFGLPIAQIHPLPASLQQWATSPDVGDYFEQIDISPVGYLIWSHFPITVAVAQPPATITSAQAERWQRWRSAVLAALSDWQPYLPLKVIEASERGSVTSVEPKSVGLDRADITIERSPPPLGVRFDAETGQYTRPRARAAQTRYEFEVTNTQPPQLRHHMTIQIAPGRSEASILATARHEIGHALGIWGHSPEPSDALYPSQVRHAAPISHRDINTLKKIYQQPTQLGWPLTPKTSSMPSADLPRHRFHRGRAFRLSLQSPINVS